MNVIESLSIDFLIIICISLILLLISKMNEIYEYKKKLKNTEETLKKVRINEIDFFIEMKELEFQLNNYKENYIFVEKKKGVNHKQETACINCKKASKEYLENPKGVCKYLKLGIDNEFLCFVLKRNKRNE